MLYNCNGIVKKQLNNTSVIVFKAIFLHIKKVVKNAIDLRKKDSKM